MHSPQSASSNFPNYYFEGQLTSDDIIVFIFLWKLCELHRHNTFLSTSRAKETLPIFYRPLKNITVTLAVTFNNSIHEFFF
jgi:hypothetical protein